MQGLNLAALAAQHPKECAGRARAAASPAYGPDSTAVIARGIKLVERGGQPPQIFALRRDPEERRDLAARFSPEQLQALRNIRESLLFSNPEAAAEPPPYSDELRQQLEALGYL